MEKDDILLVLGLEPTEARIYRALLQKGPGTISDISKATGLHRPQLYHVLPKLQQRGLLSVSPHGKRQYFAAESPSKLRVVAKDLLQNFETDIEELEQEYRARGMRPLVTYVEGAQGLKGILSDLVHTMKRGEVYYRITSTKSYNLLQKYLPRDYKLIRDQKKLERFVITNREMAKHTKIKMDRAIKVIPATSPLFEHNINEIIYANKVAFIDYETETGIIIENKAIADFQRELFLTLYRLL